MVKDRSRLEEVDEGFVGDAVEVLIIQWECPV